MSRYQRSSLSGSTPETGIHFHVSSPPVIIFWIFFSFFFTGSFSAFGQVYSDDAAAFGEYQKLNLSSKDTATARRLISIADYYVNKPGEKDSDIGMAKKCGEQALAIGMLRHAPRIAILSCIVLSQAYREAGRTDIGKKYADRSLLLSKDNCYPAENAAALIAASTYYDLYKDEERVVKVQYYTRAMPLLRAVAPNSMKLADALKYYADLVAFDSEPSAATIAMLKEAIKIYRQYRHEKLQDIYTVLCSSYTQIENPREGLRFGLLAARTAERFKDSTVAMVTLYNVLAFTYNNLQDNKNTIKSLEKAMVYAEHNKSLDSWLVLSGNLAICYSNGRQHQRAKNVIYKAFERCPPDNRKTYAMLTCQLLRVNNSLKDYIAGQSQYNFLKKLMREKEYLGILSENSYLATITFLLGTKRFAEARLQVELFQKYLSAHQIPALSSLVKVQQSLFKVDSAQGQLSSAIKHYQLFKELNDSLSKRNHNKQIAQLSVEFESEKKDQEIAQKAKNIGLLEKQSQLQQKVLTSRTNNRNLWIAAACLSTLLLTISYRSYRIGRKANLKLSEQQEEISTQNEYLKELIGEREWLLKEIHHRVKNNLQIIISLLNSQSSYLTDPAMIDLLRDSQNRMNSISLIHQKLYQTDNLAGVYLPMYINELSGFLQSSFSAADLVKFELDIAAITVDVSQAVPLGLIINEAVTNAIKYAFGPSGGVIRIALTMSSSGSYSLEISDDGRGLPEGFDIRTVESLGMNLMRGLSDQLDAELEIKSLHGVVVTVKWKKLMYSGKLPAGIDRHL